MPKSESHECPRNTERVRQPRAERSESQRPGAYLDVQLVGGGAGGELLGLAPVLLDDAQEHGGADLAADLVAVVLRALRPSAGDPAEAPAREKDPTKRTRTAGNQAPGC